MNKNTYTGKNESELLTKALEELNLTENDIYYNTTVEKVGLLKKEQFTLTVYKVSDVVEFIKNYLTELTTLMGLNVTFETQIRDKQINIKMYSDNNSILIGHNGQTLKALTNIIKQIIFNQTNNNAYILLDVENYKEKQEKYLIRLARNIAKEVASTKQEVELENMNSYERRIIHNALGEDKYVYTESVGVEPNRHIVVKPKGE